MVKLPSNVQKNAATEYLLSQGLTLISQGKVRNTFRIDDETLLVVATDRISIFDFVLPTLIQGKGEILTALTHFWLTEVIKGLASHLVSSRKNNGLNAIHDFAEKYPGIKPYLGRCLVIEDLTGALDPFELIFRHHLGGSVFKKYQETGMAGGHKLEPHLPQWSKLPIPIFTPSTKAEVGHDVNVDAKYYYQEMQEQKGIHPKDWIDKLINAYMLAYQYALKKRILILDTKFEGSGELNVLADEILTPDSSRFVDIADWEDAMSAGKNPRFMDKEVIRQWGAKVVTPMGTGIKTLNPENEEHLNFVENLDVPETYINQVISTYHLIFKKLTGKALITYQQENMGM